MSLFKFHFLNYDMGFLKAVPMLAGDFWQPENTVIYCHRGGAIYCDTQFSLSISNINFFQLHYKM